MERGGTSGFGGIYTTLRQVQRGNVKKESDLPFVVVKSNIYCE